MTFSSGQQIGAYRVIRLLGEGGMGAVYEVEHAELGTHYALKTFVYDAANEYADMLLNKFREEAKMLSRINHPYVSRAFDLTHDKERGILYYVMDLVLYKDGESYSLGEVDRASLTEDHVYRWFCDACAALDHIHSLGIVHRDVKLDNFLLNSDKHAVLADFGVSRIFGKQMKKDVAPYKTMRIKRSGSTEMTVLGSDHYIAPEVLAGQEATPAADAYGLGVMIFKLFTDRWADTMSPVQVDAFLHDYKYRWYKVIPKLVEFDPAKRPTRFVDLIDLLDREAAPVAAEKPRGAEVKSLRKKFDIVRFGLTTFFAVTFVAGASWFGYQGFLKYDADRKSEAVRMNAELRRQIAEQKETSQKIEAEQQRLRDEAARQKSEAEKIAEAKRKREAEEREKEARRITIGKQENAAEKKPSVKPNAAPVPKEKMDEFVLLDNEVEKPAKDYGPIPNKTYTWLKGGNAALPQEVKFHLSNGAVIDLVPLKAATFYMSNDCRDGRTHHKVSLTRPFWMSKYLLTADQCRDFAPNSYEDCRRIEKALDGTGYTVSQKMNRRQIDAFCQFLSEKYHQQLPKGYVFRLPTEAEWEYARDFDGTVIMYEDSCGWDASTSWSSRAGIIAMRKLRKDRGLDLVCKWSEYEGYSNGAGGYTDDWKIFVGGRMKPNANGIHDILNINEIFLDVVAANRHITANSPYAVMDIFRYDDVAVDPLAWVPDVDIYEKARSVRREWERWRYPAGMDGEVVSHVVLGPDLISEHAWERPRQKALKPKRQSALRMKPSKWNPNVAPRRLNKERKFSFTMDNGTTMEFCLCPSGSFAMSNAPEHEKLSHRVTLTRPFLFSKFNVTAQQWRDYGPFDCEGPSRELETLFEKENYPVCVKRNYLQWTRFCEYLTRQYKEILPEGYVFRLPTEAELEWAMIADENGSVKNLDATRFDDCQERFRSAMGRLLVKKNFKDARHFDLSGWYREHYVGGRVEPNLWGVYDIRMVKACLDWYEAKHWKCGEIEEDPVRWDGRYGGLYLIREGWSGRRYYGWNGASMAHIVIGYDVLKERKAEEFGSYPEDDFGGRFVGEIAKIVDMSTSLRHPANNPERHKLLLSRENVIVRERDFDMDMRACHTQKEDSPWVQLELETPVVLAGIQVDALRCSAHAEHLRVWVSDGSKELKLIASEDQVKSCYRFDLRKKNVKAKYIRIGREPGFKKEFFSLNKVLIYGK